MADTKKKDLKEIPESDVFCMAPWIHLHVWPEGEVSPCCWSTSHDNPKIDVLNENKTLKDVWNSKKIKELRLKMLSGTPSKEFCYRCYDLERAGSTSLRQKLNSDFKHHLETVKETLEDGTLSKFHMPYVDIRFSNLCNFKCRSCGPNLSSAWAAENNIKEVKKITNFYPRLMDDIIEQIETIEEIYFAGGEPLLMEEHFIILNELYKRNLTHVRLKYNTNFSKLNWQNNSITELWKKFPNVYLGASLDGSGTRAEYIRKGTNWKQILQNRELLRNECPHVNFQIESTVSALNAWHISDFIKEAIETDFIEPAAFFSNLLQHPNYLSIQALPKTFKSEVTLKLNDFIAWYKQNYPESQAGTVTAFESIINFMNEKDQSYLWPIFEVKMRHLDSVRGENISLTLPELPLSFK